MNELYLCYNDLEGGDFQCGIARTLDDWRTWALVDRDICDDEETYKILTTIPNKYLIDFICDTWQIEIESITKIISELKNKKEFIDFISINYYKEKNKR